MLCTVSVRLIRLYVNYYMQIKILAHEYRSRDLWLGVRRSVVEIGW